MVINDVSILCSDMADGNTEVDDAATLDYLKSTFNAHYNAKRQPIGLYTHPIHVSVRCGRISNLFIPLITTRLLSSPSPDRRRRSRPLT